MNSPSRNKLKKSQKAKKPAGGASKLRKTLHDTLMRAPVTSAVMLCLLLALALNAVAGLIAWQHFVVQERNRQMESFAEQNARVAAANIANYLHSVDKKLAFFSKSPSLNTALTYGDDVGLLEIENALKNSFPHAEAIRIFAVGEAKLDLDGNPPLRFSELDIIQKAEKRERVPPEAINVGGSGWRFNVVEPVPADEAKPVVGTIMITLPLTELYKSMRTGLDEVGKVTLYQTFDNNPRLVASFGEGTVYKAERINVPESPWQVEFSANKNLFQQTEVDYTLLLLVGVIAALTSIALFILLGLLIGRRIHRTQQSIEDAKRRLGQATGEVEFSGAGDFLDVEIRSEDEDLLGLEEASEAPEEDPLDISEAFEEPPEALGEQAVPDHIFRNYDIRGVVDTELDNRLAQKVGQALGSEALEKGESALIVARDARIHSPILTENLIRGIISTGCNVINIGTVPTPVLYFATETLDATKSGVMVTASHNPAEYNGFKVVMGGATRTESDIKAVRTRILKEKFRQGIGKEEHLDVLNEYIEAIFSDVALAGDISIVVDAGSGVTGKIAPRLFEELGCEVIPLYCDLDGNFPHHGPDPSDEANLQDLIQKVSDVGADLGVAFDGDGDRLAVVTPKGEIIWPDRLLMLFAKDILARNPGGDVVFDVKSSRHLNTVIAGNGGRPIMWKTGHAPMRAKVLETGAMIGGEFSGHIFIKDRWYGFDDGMYVAARLIEIMSLRDESLDEIFAEFPVIPVTPEVRVAVPEDKKVQIIEQLLEQGDFGDAKLITLDGVRAEFPYGWGLVRASNTSAHLTLRFEAESEEQLHKLKALFTREIRKIDSSIQFNW